MIKAKRLDNKYIIFLAILFFGVFAFGTVSAATYKAIGQTATLKANCSSSFGLSECNVVSTSPVTKICSVSGTSASCSVNYTCTAAGSYNVCGEAIDAFGWDSGAICTNSALYCGNVPVVSITSYPSTTTNATTSPFSFTGTNSPTSFQCHIDSAGYSSCTSPQTYDLGQGGHTFYVKALNQYGSSTDSYSWIIDLTAPTINSFTANGVRYPNTALVTNGTVNLVWSAVDTGGSGINYYDVYRAQYNSTNCSDTNKNGCAWSKIYSLPSTAVSQNDTPSYGTWWYGLQVWDNAGNCINESAGHCGGVTSDSVSRTAVGPLKVVLDHPPTATNLSVTAPNVTDYCRVTNNPPVRVSWSFSDQDSGDSQLAYEIQVATDTAAFNNSGTLVWDSGKVVSSVASSVLQNLVWQKTYYWRLKVWDQSDASSTWIYPPSPVGSPTAQPGASFTTIPHPYPNPNFTFSPASPPINTTVNFNNTSICSGSCSYSWDFGANSNPSTSDQVNPTTTYSVAATTTVTLTVTDISSGMPSGASCSTSSNLRSSQQPPYWQEIPPVSWLRNFFAYVYQAVSSPLLGTAQAQ